MAPSTSPATNASQVVLGSQSHPSWATARVAPTIHGPGKAIRAIAGATLAVALAPLVNAYGISPFPTAQGEETGAETYASIFGFLRCSSLRSHSETCASGIVSCTTAPRCSLKVARSTSFASPGYFYPSLCADDLAHARLPP